MQEKKKQQPSHVERIARRAFIKRAVAGAALAVPAIESFTKSDILVKSALASTAPLWTITASVVPPNNFLGSGTALPAIQTVINGGNATITMMPATGVWISYYIDNGVLTPTTSAQQLAGTYTFTNVTANHNITVEFSRGV
jgi:hypothetical protein